MDEIENKAEAQPAWLQLAAGAGSWGLTELGNIGRSSRCTEEVPLYRIAISFLYIVLLELETRLNCTEVKTH